jgi:hypothetical protein
LSWDNMPISSICPGIICPYPVQGRIQDFKLGGAHLKKLRRAEGGAKIFGVFRLKNHGFTPKNHFFPNLGGGGAGSAPDLVLKSVILCRTYCNMTSLEYNMLIFEKLLYFYRITALNSVHHAIHIRPPMNQRFFSPSNYEF